MRFYNQAHQYYCGVDLHARSMYTHVLDAQGKTLFDRGMCEAGRVLHHLKHNIENPVNTILIVGYQAEHTLGHRIVERQPKVRILGREFSLRAEVVVMNSLSSHADHGDLLRALGPLAGTTKRIRLVHGEPERATLLADALREAGFADVGIPDRGESVPIQ